MKTYEMKTKLKNKNKETIEEKKTSERTEKLQ